MNQFSTSSIFLEIDEKQLQVIDGGAEVQNSGVGCSSGNWVTRAIHNIAHSVGGYINNTGGAGYY